MVANLIISIGTILFSSFFLYQTFHIPESNSQTSVGADVWPLMTLLAMLVMGIILLIKTLIGYKQDKSAPSHASETAPEDTKDEEMEKVPAPELKFPRRLWWVIIITALYILAIPYIGFTITTVLLLLLTAWVMGMRKWYSLILTSVISTAVFVFVFTYFLSLPLPRGIGIFREMSLFLY